MVPATPDSPVTVAPFWQSESRPVCIKRHRSSPAVLFEERGCLGPNLAQPPSLCFSFDLSVTTGNQEDQGNTPHCAPYSPAMGESNLVPGADAAVTHSPLADSGEERPPSQPPWLNQASPSRELFSTRMELPAALRSLFSKWSVNRDLNPRRCGVPWLHGFLQLLLDKGRSPSTLKVYVAGIAAFTDLTHSQSIRRNKLVIRFLRGARRMNPPRPSSVPMWDL
ncbi:hypothetical protein F2P79_022070 [Pimephales promelas]|nr:hypothetical protein F2P79_022070 [Pimephales promelas]